MTDETPTTPQPQEQPQDQSPQVSPPQAQTPQAQTPPRQDPLQQRPQPEYGEYAPEGWVSPVSQASANEPSGVTPPSQVPGGAQAPAPSYAPPSSAPHNLGLGTAPQAPTYQPPASTPQHGAPPQHAEPVSGKGAPTSWEGGSADTPVAQPLAAPVPPAAPQYQSPQYGQQAPAAPQYQATQQFQQQPQQPGFPPAPKQQSRVADRVITIILLVVGAFGALQMALSIMTLGTQFDMLASMVGADITIPASMGTLETVGTLTLLAIYAVTLIWSIQRLRARKLTFWVPLVAGVLAFVATLVFVSIGLSMVPDLINSMTPENLDQMLQELGSVPTTP